jgi:hypothetical protein
MKGCSKKIDIKTFKTKKVEDVTVLIKGFEDVYL